MSTPLPQPNAELAAAPPKNPIFRFLKNYNNKLLNTYYTTIRLHNDQRHVAGILFDVYVDQKFDHNATIVEVKKLKLAQINNFIAFLDAGITPEEHKNLLRIIYAKQNPDDADFDLILLKRLSKNHTLNKGKK